ncbi:MAG: RcpC/CpaB family pilus assembly protein [Egibacteraceae bacterium]
MADLTTASSGPIAQSGPGSPEEIARPLRRRGGLPSGRAVVGGLLVILAAVGVFAAYTQATAAPRTRWVVAKRDVQIGQRITAGDLGLIAIDLPAPMHPRVFAESGARSLVGAVAIAPIARAELVEASDVRRAEAGLIVPEEISFPVSADRAVSGTLQPGERVDVLATYGGQDRSYTLAVVRRALLLRVNRGGGGLESANAVVLTLGLDKPDEASAIAHAVNSGKVIVVRTTAAGPDQGSPSPYQQPAPPDPARGAG